MVSHSTENKLETKNMLVKPIPFRTNGSELFYLKDKLQMTKEMWLVKRIWFPNTKDKACDIQCEIKQQGLKFTINVSFKLTLKVPCIKTSKRNIFLKRHLNKSDKIP